MGDRLNDDGRGKDVVVVALPLIGVSQAAQDPESAVGQDDAGGRFNRRTKWLEFWLKYLLEIWLHIPNSKRMFKNW